MAASQQLQEAPSAPNLECSPGSQRRRSVASTEHLAGRDRTKMVVNNQQRYPVDDITVRTPASFFISIEKNVKLVAQGIAKVHVQGEIIHGMPIP
jgi:hypothetical protein